MLDRPDFLIASSVLFYLANRSKLKEQHKQASAPDSSDDEQLSDILEYRVWRRDWHFCLECMAMFNFPKLSNQQAARSSIKSQLSKNKSLLG